MGAPTRFLNVDLDLGGRAALVDSVIAELDRRLLCLHSESVRGTRRASYELLPSPKTADATVRALLAVIEHLGPAARRGWKALRVRSFNVGVQAGAAPHATELELAAETIARVAKLGGKVVVTVYAPEVESAVGSRARTSPR